MKLIVPLLAARARLQHRFGLRETATSNAAQGWSKLGALVGDTRVLWRIWGISACYIYAFTTDTGCAGLLPIFQWLISLERNPPPTRKLLTIERLQGWSMLAYYPLEHLYYLASHGIVPSSLPTLSSLFSSSAKPIPIDLNAVGIWSCRFWAAYVLLQFAHLREDRKLLLLRERSIKKGKQPATAGELEQMKASWDGYWNEIIVNVGYLPLTVHW